jgi:hypothetical protein
VTACGCANLRHRGDMDRPALMLRCDHPRVCRARTGVRVGTICLAATALLPGCGSQAKAPAGETVTMTSPAGQKRTCIKRKIGGVYCATPAPATATSATPTITSPTGEKRKCIKSPGGGIYCPPAAATAYSTPPGVACQTQTVGVIRSGQKKVGKAKQTIPPPPGIDAAVVHGKDVTITYRWGPSAWRSCRPHFLVVAVTNRLNPYARRVVTVPTEEAGAVHVQWLRTATERPDTANVSGMMDPATGGTGHPAKVRIRGG